MDPAAADAGAAPREIQCDDLFEYIHQHFEEESLGGAQLYLKHTSEYGFALTGMVLVEGKPERHGPVLSLDWGDSPRFTHYEFNIQGNPAGASLKEKIYSNRTEREFNGNLIDDEAAEPLIEQINQSLGGKEWDWARKMASDRSGANSVVVCPPLASTFKNVGGFLFPVEQPPARPGSWAEAQAQIDRIVKDCGATHEQISDGNHTIGELYQFRLHYHAGLFNTWHKLHPEYGAHKSLCHHDGKPCDGGGWFVVSAKVSDLGLITNHYKLEAWDCFHIPSEPAERWPYDGTTSADVLDRLKVINSLP